MRLRSKRARVVLDVEPPNHTRAQASCDCFLQSIASDGALMVIPGGSHGRSAMRPEAADEISAVTDSAVPQWERSCRQALVLRNRPAAANAPDTSEEHLEATTTLTP